MKSVVFASHTQHHVARHTGCCFFILGSCLMPWVSAQDDVEFLPEITVRASSVSTRSYRPVPSNTATKIPMDVLDIPQTLDVIPQTLLKEQQGQSLADTLRHIPSISLSLGDGQRDQVFVRGFRNIQDYYIDGVRDDATYYRDPSNIERIEVLKGPSAVLYGRGSSGGIINVVSKKPEPKPKKELGWSVGRWNQRATWDVGQTWSSRKVQARLTGAIEHSSHFRPQYFLRRYALSPSLAWQFSPDTRLTLQANALRDYRMSDQGLPGYKGAPAPVPHTNYYGSSRAREDDQNRIDVNNLTLSLDHRINSQSSLRHILRVYNYDLDRNYNTVGQVDEDRDRVLMNHVRRLRKEKGWFSQNEWQHAWQWGQVKHKSLIGLELGWQRKGEILWKDSEGVWYDLFNPQLVDMPGLDPNIIPAQKDVSTDVQLAAIYAQNIFQWKDRWQMLLGVRFDHLRQDRDDHRPINMDLKRTDRTWSPRWGLVYQVQPGWNAYAMVSQSFQPLVDLYVFKTNSAELKPERTINYELGSKWSFGKDAVAQVAIFDMRKTGIHNADPEDSTRLLDVGEQQVRGLEASISGSLSPRWHVYAGYSYLDGRIIRSTEKTTTGESFVGKRSALTPRHAGSIWLKYRWNKAFQTYAGVKYEGERFTSSDNLVRLPAYTRVDVGTSYDAKRWGAQLLVENVLNRKYFISAHGAANHYNMPGTPRHVKLSVQYRF